MTRLIKINAQILSAILSVTLIGTMLQATTYAAESGDVSIGVSSILIIHSFDALEPPFLPVEDSENTYSLTAEPGTTLTGLNLPNRLAVAVERTSSTTHLQDEELRDFGAVEKMSEDLPTPGITPELAEEELSPPLLLEATEELPQPPCRRQRRLLQKPKGLL